MKKHVARTKIDGVISGIGGFGGLFAGCNFWAWGGFAEQNSDHIYWEKGDDYTGDPAQEEQGLNSVFATDTTVEIIKTENAKLK